MNRVKQVIDWALADGLYVVINVHHDSWQWIADMPTNHDNVLARFKATWTQIAAKFKDSSPALLFESINEPQFNSTTDALEAGALTHYGSTGQCAVAAATAGMDLILCSARGVSQGEAATAALANAQSGGQLDTAGFIAAADRIADLRARLH